MRSAYVLLGIPGNATTEDIEAAFRKAQELYPRERLATDEGAMARLNEVKEAYRVLSDRDARAAHDRKLSAAAQRPVTRTVLEPVKQEFSVMHKLLAGGLVLVVLVFATGFTLQWRNAETRRVAAAQELAAREAEAKEAEQKRVAAERLAADQAQAAARAAAKSEADDRRAANEAQYAAARAQSDISRQEANAAANRRMAMADQQRQEANRQNEDRRAAMEARMRVERDKQRVRELCYQLYRRPDC
jgi:curved DNA-binding protein CbpA